MRNWAALVCVLLAACASPQPRMRHRNSSSRTTFSPRLPSRVTAADVFALSDRMKLYLKTEITPQLRLMGPQRGLIHALYQRDQLKLQYDASMTRNASQAFDARAGNCLSLVVMTAAFAKEIGLKVRVSERVSGGNLGAQRRPSRAQRPCQCNARQKTDDTSRLDPQAR